MVFYKPYMNQKNIDIFLDSQKIIETSDKLVDATTKSIQSQMYYDPRDILVKPTEILYPVSTIKITTSKTFDAARKYNGKTAVLNFASATTPGGGCKTGANAQEECLCRVSNLWNCLNDQNNWDVFYNPHRRSHDSLHSDRIIYTPDVMVFKDDGYNLLPEEDWKTIDVITCAAPNLKKTPITDVAQTAIIERRVRRILTVAAVKKVQNLVLGAFGCGVFKNDPKIVAEAFRKELENFRGVFENVEFAVYCNPEDDSNYQIFKRILG